MDINQLIADLTEGLPAEQAAIVRASIERDTVRNKAAGWKQQNEYAALESRAATLQRALEGEGADKPGAAAYKKWYDDNYPSIEKLNSDIAKYKAKYGEVDATPQNQGTGALTEEQVRAMVSQQFQEKIAPGVAATFKKFGAVVQKHIYAKRETPLDFEALDKLMGERNLTLDQAYEEYDKPEREKAQKLSTEAEVERRVKEELQRRGASQNFPAGSDFTSTPGALASRSKTEVDKFDKRTMASDLISAWTGGGSN